MKRGRGAGCRRGTYEYPSERNIRVPTRGATPHRPPSGEIPGSNRVRTRTPLPRKPARRPLPGHGSPRLYARALSPLLLRRGRRLKAVGWEDGEEHYGWDGMKARYGLFVWNRCNSLAPPWPDSKRQRSTGASSPENIKKETGRGLPPERVTPGTRQEPAGTSSQGGARTLPGCIPGRSRCTGGSPLLQG